MAKLGHASSAQGQTGKTEAKLEHHETLRSAKTNIDFCPKDRREPKTRPTTRGQKLGRNRAELGDVGKQIAERCGEISVEVLSAWWARMSSSAYTLYTTLLFNLVYRKKKKKNYQKFMKNT